MVAKQAPAPAVRGLEVIGTAAFRKGASAGRPSMEEIGAAAKVVRARKELNQLAELRLIHRAARISAPQDAIAALLGTSQPTVSRALKRIEQDPAVLDPSPREAINQRAVGQIDTESMMGSLVSYRYAPGSYDPTAGDGFVRGDWRQIEDALVAGLITDAEYERIAREAPIAKSDRGAR